MKRALLEYHLTISVLLTACLAFTMLGVAQAQDDNNEVRLVVLLGEFYFQVEGQERNAPIILEAGTTYHITFRNIGMMEHEVLIGRGLVTDNGRPDGYEVNLLEGLEVELEGDGWMVEVLGVVEFELQPEVEITLVLTVPEELRGEWEIGCFVPGHYEAGMHVPFIVE